MIMDYDYKNLVVTLRNKLIMTQEEFAYMLLDVVELQQLLELQRHFSKIKLGGYICEKHLTLILTK